jgi:hypothetical protein
MEQLTSGEVPLVGDLQIEEDLKLERRGWIFERIGWLAMFLIVLAALAGLIGNGPLSSDSAAAQDESLTVEYDRFQHYHHQETLTVRIAGEAAGQNEVRLWFDQKFLSEIEIKRISPEPSDALVGNGRHVFVFPVADQGKSTEIIFHFEPDKIGAIHGHLGIEDRDDVQFVLFTYP